MEFETLGPEKVLWIEKRKEVLEDVLQLPVLGIGGNQPELLKTFSNSNIHTQKLFVIVVLKLLHQKILSLLLI